MTQPEYVPIPAADRARQGDKYPPPRSWTATRPADLRAQRAPEGRRFGNVGPDAGYGLKLAKRVGERAQLVEGEHLDDAVTGCLVTGLKRASLFGRAPVIYDMELAFTLWGYLGGAPADLLEFRVPLFAGAAHHYWDQRGIADLVPDTTLRMTPQQVTSQLSGWRSLVVVAS